MWKEPLSLVVFILGIYIVYLAFPSNTNVLSPSDTSYHIGCYDPGIKHSHSSDIGERLEMIQSKRQKSLKLNMFNSIALRSNFEEQIQEIAGGFEDYLDEYYRLKFQNQQDLHYHNSLKVAKYNFEKCIAELNLNELDCHKAWQQYLQVTDQFDKLKIQLGDLILRKQKQEKLVAVNVFQHNDKDQEQIQNQYNLKVNQIYLKIKLIDEELIIIEGERKKVHKEIELIDSELESLKKLRSQCPERKSFIIFCREVTKTVRQLGVKIEDTKYDRLQHRIKIKQDIMKALESGIKKMKKFGNSQQLQTQQRMLERHRRELDLLKAEIETIQTTEQAICLLCSEQKIEEMDRDIAKLEESKQKWMYELEISTKKRSSFYDKKSDFEKETIQAFQQYEAQISALLCYEQSCKYEHQQKLQEAQRTLNVIKKEIIDKRIQINDFQDNLKSKVNKLGSYLKEISGASDCMRKKQYYKQLLKQNPTRKLDEEQMVKAKQQIVKELTEFDL